jgi:hypothetical protein
LVLPVQRKELKAYAQMPVKGRNNLRLIADMTLVLLLAEPSHERHATLQPVQVQQLLRDSVQQG